jgi:hypothetical protein
MPKDFRTALVAVFSCPAAVAAAGHRALLRRVAPV